MRAPFEDLGFADPEAARLIAQRRGLVRELAMRQSAPSKFFDVHIEKDGSPRVRPGEQLPTLSRYHLGVIAQCAIQRIGCDDVSHHELVQALKSVLEFVELVLGDFGHGGGSLAADNAGSTPSDAASHRFDGGAK